MRRVSTVFVAVVTATLISILVYAQPITGGGGLSRVFHSSAFYGTGTSMNTLDLRHDCSSGSGLAWDGSAWACTGGGGGSGGGFTVAGAGLVGSGSTVNVIAATNGMIAVGSDSIGLDGTGCTSGQAAVYAGSGVWHCATVAGGSGGGSVTPSLAISQAATTGTPNLTTLGTIDWLVFQAATPTTYPTQYSRKITGGKQIDFPQVIGNPNAIGTQVRTQAVTWTPADNVSQGSAGAGWNVVDLLYDPSATGFGLLTSAVSFTTSRKLVVYVGNYNETVGVTCTATMADGEASPASTTFTMTGTDNRAVTTTFISNQVTKVSVACVVTSNPAGVNFGWLAMWLA